MSSSGYETLFIDPSWPWHFTRNSTWNTIISIIHTWPPQISLIICKTICRQLPAIQSIKSVQNQTNFENDLDELQIWANKCGIKFSASQCQIMRIHKSTKPLERFYILNNHVLAQVDTAKYLGVMITEMLDWSLHVNSFETKSNRCIDVIKETLASAHMNSERWPTCP